MPGPTPSQLYHLPRAPSRCGGGGAPPVPPHPPSTRRRALAGIVVGVVVVGGLSARLTVGELPETVPVDAPRQVDPADVEAREVFALVTSQLEAVDQLTAVSAESGSSMPAGRPHASSRAVAAAVAAARDGTRADTLAGAYAHSRAHDALLTTLARREREAADLLLLERAHQAREAGATGRARHIAVTVRARSTPPPYPNHLLRAWVSLLEAGAPLAELDAARTAAWDAWSRRVQGLAPAALGPAEAYSAALEPEQEDRLLGDPRTAAGFVWALGGGSPAPG